MSIQFSRSTRSLNNDSGSVGLIAAVSMVTVVIAWLLWFFFAQVPLYETSRDFTVRRDGHLMVQFSEEALTRIQPGQKADFLPLITDNKLGESRSVLVMNTPASTGQREKTVEIYIDVPPTPDTAGEIRIIVDHVSPFALVLQSAQ